MKTIYRYFVWITSLMAVNNRTTMALVVPESHIGLLVEPFLAKKCAYYLSDLRSNIELKDHKQRKRVAQLLVKDAEKLSPSNLTLDMIADLKYLLSQETSPVMLEYFVFFAGRLGTPEVGWSMIKLFYSHYQNESLSLSILKALRFVRPRFIGGVSTAKLVLYATQNCSETIYEKTWQLPYYYGCEEAVMEQLVAVLAYDSKKMTLDKRLLLIDAIKSIKHRSFFTKSQKQPSFTNKAIDAFCDLLKYTSDLDIVSKSINALLHTYSPNLYKVLTDLLEDQPITYPFIKKEVIEWIGSINKFGRRKSCRAFLLKRLEDEDIDICFAAFAQLGDDDYTPVLTISLLKLLKKHCNNKKARKWLIRTLEPSPLLVYRNIRLFYDSTTKPYRSHQSTLFSFNPEAIYNAVLVRQKNYQHLRKEMIRGFRFVLNNIEESNISLYGISNLTDESVKLIKYLAYLKDEDINDCLWDLLQYKKEESSLRKELKFFYLHLYQQTPFFLLKPSSQQKLLHLYIRQFGLFLHKLFFSDLPRIIFRYLFLDVVDERLPYESLPVMYTGKKRGINQRYASSKCLEVFEY